MRRISLLVSLMVALTCCASASLPTHPNDREWNAILADYQWLETLRKALPATPPNASRKEQIQRMLANLQKIEPAYVAFMDKLREYYLRTGDPRAAPVQAREKTMLGDQYLTLSRYDRAIELYREALVFTPNESGITERIAGAETRRFVSMNAFSAIRPGMTETDASKLVGYPREDWIKQVVQNNRAYSLWIYPRADGGAAAVYFDNGVVYHTNWNAAVPPAAPSNPGK